MDRRLAAIVATDVVGYLVAIMDWATRHVLRQLEAFRTLDWMNIERELNLFEFATVTL